jgi:hypothetical protein
MKHYFLKMGKENLFLVRENARLFLGIALFLLGVLDFSNGKYCDGNPADYYSCTNPSAYYYYSPLAIAFCILGAFCITIWFLKRFER